MQRRGHRHQHGDLLAVRRLGRHRLRHPVDPGAQRRRPAPRVRPDPARLARRPHPGVTPEIAESLGLRAVTGALVASVTPNGPAAEAGIQAGDVILTFDGKEVNEMRRLPRVVAETGVEEKVPVKLWRRGKEQTVQVKVGELEAAEESGVLAAIPDEPAPTATEFGRGAGAEADQHHAGTAPAVRPQRAAQGRPGDRGRRKQRRRREGPAARRRDRRGGAGGGFHARRTWPPRSRPPATPTARRCCCWWTGRATCASWRSA